MRVVLVHDWLTGMRGGEKCLEVACRLWPDAPLLTLLHRRGGLSPAIERMDIRTSFLQRIPGIVRHYRYALPLMPRAIRSLAVPADADVVLSFSHAVAKGVTLPRGVPHVCYCFTPMRYAWHRRADYFAARPWYARPIDWPKQWLLDRLRHWDRATSAGVTHFVAISQTVAARIRQCYDRSSEVICPPVDTDFYWPDASPRDDYFVCLSALVAYKRIDLAIEACNRLKRRLLVIGDGPERGRLARLAGPTVELAGWTSDEGIRGHLRRCRALLFPANEDFGIVPLEAQACGCPVIAFGQGGATETVLPIGSGSGTGWLFAEQTAEAIAETIVCADRESDRFDATLARTQAERFSLPRFERELAEYVERVAATGAAGVENNPKGA